RPSSVFDTCSAPSLRRARLSPVRGVGGADAVVHGYFSETECRSRHLLGSTIAQPSILVRVPVLIDGKSVTPERRFGRRGGPPPLRGGGCFNAVVWTRTQAGSTAS